MFLPYRVEEEEIEAERPPVVTYAIIVLNALVFGFGLHLPNDRLLLFLYRFGFAAAGGSPITVLTYMFLHAGWLHILGNMYFLWLFGRALERVLGRAKFAAFYILAGIVAVLTHAVFVPAAIADVPCVGASGAISGVLGAFAVLRPNTYVESVILLFGTRPAGTIRLRAYFVLGFWFVMQLITQYVMGNPMIPSGVAYGAHIGGFLFGWTVCGTARVVCTAATEWGEIAHRGALSGIASRVNAGEPLPSTDLAEPDVQCMLFLKNGTLPLDVAVLSNCVPPTDKADANAAMAASVLLGAHLANAQDRLSVETEVRGAHALAQLGYARPAIACLLDGLQTAREEAAQEMLCALGTLFWKYVGDCATALRCLDKAVAIDEKSAAAARADRVRTLILHGSAR